MPNYNNGYPVTYPTQDQLWQYQPAVTQTPYYQPRQWQATTSIPQYQPQNMQPISNGSMIWVQGEAGAKAYSNLQPGIPVALWDSEEQVIYIKTVDQSGKPTMTILDYVDRNAPVVNEDKPVEYATKEQFDSLNGQINDLSGHISDIENRINTIGKSQSNQNQSNRRGNK